MGEKKSYLILPALVFFLILIHACQKNSTIQGLAYETKGGLMVEGVVIPEEKIPGSQVAGAFSGKRVEVKGLIVLTEDEKPEGGIQVQRREGPYQYFKHVESIKIVGSN